MPARDSADREELPTGPVPGHVHQHGRPTSPVHPSAKAAIGIPHAGPTVMQEGYSHELARCGSWPGGGEEGPSTPTPIPIPPGYADSAVGSAAAFRGGELAEFLLPHEAVATATDPDGCWHLPALVRHGRLLTPGAASLRTSPRSRSRGPAGLPTAAGSARSLLI